MSRSRYVSPVHRPLVLLLVALPVGCSGRDASPAPPAAVPPTLDPEDHRESVPPTPSLAPPAVTDGDATCAAALACCEAVAAAGLDLSERARQVCPALDAPERMGGAAAQACEAVRVRFHDALVRAGRPVPVGCVATR